MNRLPTHKRVQILHMLVEGMSMRAASRIADVSINTVYKLMKDAGQACADWHDKAVRNVHCRYVQCDEIWAFCYAKDKNLDSLAIQRPDAGSIWTWTALDPESKLLISYRVGDRDLRTGREFMLDLRDRITGRVQLTTDGLSSYVEAVEEAFGAGVDFAQLVKSFTGDGEPRIAKSRLTGRPELNHISTSLIERHNLTIRMGNRRYARRTNAHSKRLLNHNLMLSLFFAHYNFCRVHQTIQVTPAMAAGITRKLLGVESIVDLIDERAPKPNRPKFYVVKS